MDGGNRVRAVRSALGLTQTEFGKKIGMSQSQMTNVETGINGVTEKTLRVICSVFGVSEDWLRTGKGEMFQPGAGGMDLDNLYGCFLELSPVLRKYAVEELRRLALLQADMKEQDRRTDEADTVSVWIPGR